MKIQKKTKNLKEEGKNKYKHSFIQPDYINNEY